MGEDGTSLSVLIIAKFMWNVNKTAVEVNIMLSEVEVHGQCEHSSGRDH
jgi:hypothetical protein